MTSAEQYQAANRFGLGSSRRDLAAMGGDPRGWLLDQLAANVQAPGPQVGASSVKLAGNQTTARKRRIAQDRADGNSDEIRVLEQAQQTYRRQMRQLVLDQTAVWFEHTVETELPFLERLVRFWSNHFCVSRQGNPQIVDACVAYENEAIRASMNGYFSDMLLNVVSHPVMLVYLDNARSVGPDSMVGRRRGVGLNENLAREVLELHTMGVNGGYDQDDVKSLAAMLTGWTVGNDRLARARSRSGGRPASSFEPGTFVFVPAMHQPGGFKLLGKRYADNGADQAAAALRDIAAHPATARHLAAKLVRHFVADEPPERDVEQIVGVFTETHGHLPSLHAALVALSEAWAPESRKLKNPQEYLISAYRGLEIPLGGRLPRQLQILRLMNHMPFGAPSPAGWPDTFDHWASPDGLKQRIQWGIAMGTQIGNRVDAEAAVRWTTMADGERGLARSIRKAESPAQAMGLLLASPEFQWR